MLERVSTLASPVPESLHFDHLGLLVRDLAEGRTFLQTALGIGRWTVAVDDAGLGVRVQFGEAGSGRGPTYELIAPLGDGSPIAQQLDRNRGILNHVAYTTASLATAGEHLRGTGCFPATDPAPALAYDGRLVQFWMSPLRFLIELIEKPCHQHLFAPVEQGQEPAL